MKDPNLILRLPRELRDEIYTHIFTPAPLQATIICRQPGLTPSTNSFTEKSQTLAHPRYRITTTTEAEEIQAAGLGGCQTWPSKDGLGYVISTMLETSILRVNKQIGHEARHSLLTTIFKSTVLYVPPAGTRIAFSPSWKLTLQQATHLDLIPFSWRQLQQIIPILAANKHLHHLTVSFKRMLKSADTSDWPEPRNIKYMLSHLSTIHVASEAQVEIIWYADLQPSAYFFTALKEPEKEFCRRAIAITKRLMAGGGEEQERAWLMDHDSEGSEFTRWDAFCERIDVPSRVVSLGVSGTQGRRIKKV
jgi:hypothetical protein